jgi:FMN-dependent dehydrogenase
MGNTAAEKASAQPRHMAQPQQQQTGAMKFSNLIELEAMAKVKLTANAYNYYASGAGGGETVQENRDAFQRLRLLPRIMVDVSAVDTSVSFFGTVGHPSDLWMMNHCAALQEPATCLEGPASMQPMGLRLSYTGS